MIYLFLDLLNKMEKILFEEYFRLQKKTHKQKGNNPELAHHGALL